MVDEPATPSETGQADPSTAGSASVVVASFKSRRIAERMVASLGHTFRHQALKGSASAFVVARNGDGSFRLSLEGGPERLHGGVVIAVAGRSMGRNQARAHEGGW